MGIYQDCLILITFFVSIFFIGRTTRSISKTLIIVSMPLFGLGVVLQLLEQQAVFLKSFELGIYIAITVAVTALIASRFFQFDDSSADCRSDKVFFTAATLLIFMAVVISRLFSQNCQEGVLLQITSFTSAEDNGGWLDVAARLASGQTLRFGQVGGPLVVYLSICQNIGRIISQALSGEANELAVATNTLFVAYMLIYVIVAVSLTLLIRKFNLKSQTVKIVLINLSIWFLACGGFALSQSSGHLSFEFAIAYFLIGIAWFYGQVSKSRLENLLVVSSLILVTPIWLPLNLLGICLLIPACWYILQCFRENKTISIMAISISGFIGSAAIVLYQSIKYSSSSVSQAKSLFSADGGTAAVSSTGTLIAVSLIVILLFVDSKKASSNGFYSEVFLFSTLYVLFINYVNYWLTGSAGYGSTKIYFGLLLVILPLLLQKLTLHLISTGKFEDSWRTIFYLTTAILLLCFVDGRGSAFMWYLSPNQFAHNSDNETGNWQQYVYISSEPKKVESLPIGCITVDDSGDYSADMETYTCTRLLVSLSGKWSDALPLIEYQLMPDQKRSVQLKELDESFLSYSLLTLYSVDHKVRGEIKISEFLNTLED